ncbi:type II secretion system F family protein [Crenobacter intestini]|uniref:Type II secretion system F family protein n=1 Tax=Crenobacter intestini TaxID=2563443 RepID=A0A4T0V118_9NEIS|nr:type II secretion system F family protein [Crenobacter intestini]TIC85242.1 type II secretion system F family protein [Crenobacter intestini]
MDTLQWLYLALVFAVVFGVSMFAFVQFSGSRLQQRLDQIGKPAAQAAGAGDAGNGWLQSAERLSRPFAGLSLPKEGWEASPLRQRFMHAGLRDPLHPPLFFGAKTLLALALPLSLLAVLLVTGSEVRHERLLLGLLSAAALGYYLPNVWLARRIRLRQREIFEAFPDAIDLLLVCIEAGLGIDAALAKVAEEMQIKSELLAQELHLVNLELRAGSSKEKALRNLALRTGVEEVDSLVGMLVQAERFGTSIGDSLRVHADTLRTKRRQRAEEAAAKIPLKLLFPLIFCIFPALLLVLLGPAFISIHRVLLPTLSGGG